MIMRSPDYNSAPSEGYWSEYSNSSESSMERQRDPRHNRRTKTQIREESYAKSQSPHQSEEEEDFVQETPEAALVAAHAYLLTTQLEPGDPREHMHQAAIRSLRLVEDKLMGKLLEEKVTRGKGRRKEESKRKSSRNEPNDSSEDEKQQKRKEDARNVLAQARVNNSRYAWREEIMKTMKKRWARCVLPVGFAKRGYPKVSKCHMIKKSMTGRRSLFYGCQITCKQYRYSEEQEQQLCKVCSYTSPAQQGPG
jgi:hypothetical protein